MRINTLSIIQVLLIVFSFTIIADEIIINYPVISFIWPSAPPAGNPFETSEEIVSVFFTGNHATYTDADTWYPSWASDDILYSPWTDGSIGDEVVYSCWGASALTGQAKIVGDDPMSLQVTSLGSVLGSATPYGGRYPCGSLVYNGVWYYGTYCLGPSSVHNIGGFDYNWPWLGPLVGFRISKDNGLTWTDTPHTPENPLFGESGMEGHPLKIGAPHFVDFGKNMEHSPDGKAYLVGMGAEVDDPLPRDANLSWISGDQIYLIRVVPNPENINDMSKYGYFCGHDPDGNPVWTNNFSEIKPLIDWNNNTGVVTITYNAPLQKYLMCVTDGWPTVESMNTYILEADKITGPWKMVSYMEDFGTQGYFVNIPTKFISGDGRTMWLSYSGNFTESEPINPPGGRYAWCLQEMQLFNQEMADNYDPDAKDPLNSEENAAKIAQVTASSIQPDYSAEAAIDGVVEGYPNDYSVEWASNGEGIGATLRLTWDTPQLIDKVWLFDRPNNLDQITSGKITFSYGTSIQIGELPDTLGRGKEVTFDAREILWLEFAVTGVKAGSQNIGLAEIGAFRQSATPIAKLSDYKISGGHIMIGNQRIMVPGIGPISLEVYDVAGKLLTSMNTNINNRHHLKRLRQGIFLVRIRQGSYNKIYKVCDVKNFYRAK